LPSYFVAGESERALAQKFQANLMLQGAEKTPYVAMSCGLNGYLSGSTWPSDRSISEGDVLMIDTGSRLGGYFCDFNRNFESGDALPPSCWCTAAP
jgi:Xaa-Pro aminopeptidase